MSQQSLPLQEDAQIKFIDKPVLAQMLSGGLIIAIILFIIVNRSLNSLNLNRFDFISYLVAFAVIFASIRRAKQVDVEITINTKTGWINAETRSQIWEGYIHEAEKIQVLQREIDTNRDQTIIEYKILLNIADGSFYEIPLTYSQSAKAIEAIELAKKAVSVLHQGKLD